jgi:hypothetical protein
METGHAISNGAGFPHRSAKSAHLELFISEVPVPQREYRALRAKHEDAFVLCL